MIGNKQKNEEQTSNGLHNVLVAGTTIKGNISTDTDFRLDGKVEGDIICQAKIVVGPKGSVNGNITSNNANTWQCDRFHPCKYQTRIKSNRNNSRRYYSS